MSRSGRFWGNKWLTGIGLVVTIGGGYISLLLLDKFDAFAYHFVVWQFGLVSTALLQIIQNQVQLKEQNSEILSQHEFLKVLSGINPMSQKYLREELLRITNSIKKINYLPFLQQFEIKRLGKQVDALAKTPSHKKAFVQRRLRRDHERETFNHLVNELLPKSSEYCTVSNFRFWSPELIDQPKGYVRTNIDAIEDKEISFYRVILVHDFFEKLHKLDKEILNEHEEYAVNNEQFNTRIAYMQATPDVYVDRNFAICSNIERTVNFMVKVKYEEDRVKKLREGISEYRYTGLFFSAFGENEKGLIQQRNNLLTTFKQFYLEESISITDYKTIKFRKNANIKNEFDKMIANRANFPKPRLISKRFS